MGLLSLQRTKVVTTATACPLLPPCPSPPDSWKATWPSCSKRRPRTDSFRAVDHGESRLGASSTAGTWTDDADDLRNKVGEGDVINSWCIMQGHAWGGRLQFDAVGTTRSILEESKARDGFRYKEGKVVVVESDDPYLEFRSPMEEMIVAHGVGEDPVALRQLLDWYLKVNQENTHQLIFQAFIDSLLQLSSPPSTSSSLSGHLQLLRSKS